MTKAQRDFYVASTRGRSAQPRPIRTDLLLTVPTLGARASTTPIRRHKRPSGDKGYGLWRTVKPSYRTAVTVDARWSA